MDHSPGAPATARSDRSAQSRQQSARARASLESGFGGADPALLADLLDQVDIAVVVIDPGRRTVVHANRQAREILAAAVGDGGPDGFEILLRACDGGLEGNWGRARTATLGERTVGFTTYRLQDGRACLFARDITQRSRVDGLAAAQAWAENLESLFSTIRHELANPLNAVKMTLSVLQHNIARFPAATVDDYLRRAMGEIAKLERLLTALRTFGAMGTPRPRPVPVAEFLDQIATSLQAELEARGIAFATSIEPETGCMSADPVALRQVVSNLVSNAVDATAGEEHPLVRIAARRAGNLILLQIHDNGCGIPEDLQPRLFEPFVTSKPAALGLGLAVARKLLVQMGAQLTISSAPGAGTEATISLADPSDTEAK